MNKIPQILIDCANILSESKIKISENIEGEGRAGSLIDEGSAKEVLLNNEKIAPYILNEGARSGADFYIKDPVSKLILPINIKTSKGSSDNATSRAGIVYALTDLSFDSIPGSMNWIVFDNLLTKHKADIPHKDYYYLCIDKNDSSKVLIRGMKQIVNWVENADPSNKLQINWVKEKDCDPIDRTYEQAYDTLVMGIVRCLKKHHKKLPEKWQQIIEE